jgi:hypothetical protein
MSSLRSRVRELLLKIKGAATTAVYEEMDNIIAGERRDMRWQRQ